MASLLSTFLMKFRSSSFSIRSWRFSFCGVRYWSAGGLRKLLGCFGTLPCSRSRLCFLYSLQMVFLDRLKRLIEFICQLPVGISLFNMQPQELFHNWPWCDVVRRMFWHMALSFLSLLYRFSSLLSITHFSWSGATTC